MSAEWFADRLRELRAESGLSRKELAERAGLRSEAGIRDIEQGVNKPSWEMVVALCKALGVGCDAFLQPPSPDLPPSAPGRPRKASADAGGANAEADGPERPETTQGVGTAKRKRGGA